MINIITQIFKSIFIINLFKDINVPRIFYKYSQTYGRDKKRTVIYGKGEHIVDRQFVQQERSMLSRKKKSSMLVISDTKNSTLKEYN